jgi:hypothetical protein
MKIISTKITMPQLSRRCDTQNKQQTIKIIVSPQKKEIQDISKFNNAINIKPPPVSPPQMPKVMPNQAVSRKGISQPKQGQQKINVPKAVVYITENTTPDNIPKINGIRNRGQGKILVVIGNGPSINEVELQRLKYNDKIEILSINKPDPRLWPTTYWSFYDPTQVKRHNALIDSYDGLMFNSTAIKRIKNNSIRFKNLAEVQYSKDLSHGLCIGRSSCYAAMQIASWMDFDKTFFFGVDMDSEGINGQLHFYGVNPDVDPNVRKNRFKDESTYYDKAAESLEPEERKKFYFCSDYNKWPFVNQFNKLNQNDAIDYILSCI